ncbi:hypothetical protein K2173_010238 [Erythroxylum novogranatense]|uniref:Helicase C-terminal domain-containing protein n=1 Tax=Erythroxylum novogranatense TaxID=1862640 RepID=A0AAV8U9C7_9ROSI|nr:hypothetical protein K2173_010238 [Erythroxylum novogranatense]
MLVNIADVDCDHNEGLIALFYQVNNISGYLPGQIVFFLVNTHLTPRPMLLTGHGESRFNVRGRIDGDGLWRTSRGIDFAGVDHVVLFDFPRDPSEYVRRVGSTARVAGGNGKAFIFVVGKQVFLARKIVERNQKGHPLHDVPAVYISG